MPTLRYIVSVPGSIMLLGEHAVLYGYRALACAINQRISVELIPEEKQTIKLYSKNLGKYQTSISKIQIVKPFDYVLAAIQYYQSCLKFGFTLTIHAEFAHNLGLGSSASVTVATLAVLQRWLQPQVTYCPQDLFEQSLTVIRKVQFGLASGSDVAASIFGGVISIQPEQNSIEKVKIKSLPFELIYSGYKTPSVTVINKVKKLRDMNLPYIDSILKLIGKCSELGYKAIQQNDLQALGKIFIKQQKLFQKLNLNDETSDSIINLLITDADILGAKISGSGLGDCIIGLGKIKNIQIWKNFLHTHQRVRHLKIKMTNQGIKFCES